MSAILALISSLMWGVSDFVGGAASRRVDPLRITALSNPLGVLPLVVFTLLIPGTLSAGSLWAGLAAGLFGAFGILLLYVALAAGPMGVMSPVTAVVSAAIPVAFGLIRGERPSVIAYVGMIVAVLAIVLVSLETAGAGTVAPVTVTPVTVRPRILAIAVLAGVCIGLYLAFIGIAPDGSGIWSVLIARIVSSVIVVTIGLFRLRAAVFERSVLLSAGVVGLLDASANAFYRLSAQIGSLAVVAVLAALYPAATVLLARFLLHERLRRVQQAGMVLALVAAALLGLAST